MSMITNRSAGMPTAAAPPPAFAAPARAEPDLQPKAARARPMPLQARRQITYYIGQLKKTLLYKDYAKPSLKTWFPVVDALIELRDVRNILTYWPRLFQRGGVWHPATSTHPAWYETGGRVAVRHLDHMVHVFNQLVSLYQAAERRGIGGLIWGKGAETEVNWSNLGSRNPVIGRGNAAAVLYFFKQHYTAIINVLGQSLK